MINTYLFEQNWLHEKLNTKFIICENVFNNSDKTFQEDDESHWNFKTPNGSNIYLTNGGKVLVILPVA